MRRKRLRRYVSRLQALQGQALSRDQLLMKLGAAKRDAGRAANLVVLSIPIDNVTTASLEFKRDRAKLRQVREDARLSRRQQDGRDDIELAAAARLPAR